MHERDSGYTLIEIIIVTAVIGILAAAIMPLARVTMQRQREVELRRDLREMRTAIDKYKDAIDLGRIAPESIAGSTDGYPPTLDVLVEGVPLANDTTGGRMRF